MGTKITINISADKIISDLHLEPGGTAQRFMTSEVKRLSDPYTPMDAGILKSNVVLTADTITYNSPYARYQWHGKVMAGNPKAATSKNLKYQGSPMRGKEWVTRAMIDRKKDVIKAVENFIKRG